MRKMISSVLLGSVCLITLVQSYKAQEVDSVLREPSFDVRLNKKTYLLYEPMFAQFAAKLRAQDNKPLFLNETSVKVKFAGETKDFGKLGLITGSPQRLPKILLPNLDGLSSENNLICYEKEENIERVREFFPRAGNYQIQFFLHGSAKGLASNVIDITIETPTGINKEAFNFLNQYESDTPFDWVWTQKKGVASLEEFVNKYSQSVYGDLAIQYLGNIYLAKGEFDKAWLEFEKLKNSEHKTLAEDAKRSLVVIEKRKAEREKSLPPE